MPLANARFARSIALICLPTVVVAALGARFLVADVPQIVRNEKNRAKALSERYAKEMRADHSLADFVWERGRGVVAGSAPGGPERWPPDMPWKDWRPEGGTKNRDMWGWREAPGGRLVWARGASPADFSRVYARFAPVVERDYATTFYLFGPLFLLVLAWATAAGVKHFADCVRTRDDFMAAAAHDLSTPLSALRLLVGHDDETARNLAERLVRIVANIKDFMRLGGRRPPPEKKPFRLEDAFAEAYASFAADFRDLADGRDVVLEGSAPPVLGDTTLAVQILWNLLGNDLKYAAPHGRVTASLYATDGFAALELRDEGPGMSRREMKRAFNRYYRAKTVLQSGKGGFGIGLCAAREFAVAMGGSLSVRANSPRGCVFTLSLPLAP